MSLLQMHNLSELNVSVTVDAAVIGKFYAVLMQAEPVLIKFELLIWTVWLQSRCTATQLYVAA